MSATCCPHSDRWHRLAYRGEHDIGQRNVRVCDYPGCECIQPRSSGGKRPPANRSQTQRTGAGGRLGDVDYG